MNKLNNEDWVQYLLDNTNNEYNTIDEYNGARNKILIKHNICSSEYYVTPTNFKKGTRCPKCMIKERNLKLSDTIDNLKNKVRELVGDEYCILESKYVNRKSQMMFKHNKCGFEWMTNSDSFLSGTRCPKCSNIKNGINKRKSTNDFKKEIYDLVGDEYELLDSYKTATEKVKLLHTVCGNIYNVEPNSFLNGNRCNHCNRISSSSKGEKRIKEILDNNNIQYIEQYKFDDCKNKFKLPFDFAIIKNNKVNSIIEFDGRQHFEPIEMWGGLDNYNKIKINDDIKNRYCLDNNIELVRIPHWDYENIEFIINHLF